MQQTIARKRAHSDQQCLWMAPASANFSWSLELLVATKAVADDVRAVGHSFVAVFAHRVHDF